VDHPGLVEPQRRQESAGFRQRGDAVGRQDGDRSEELGPDLPERAIVQELHLMMEQILKMRTSLVLEDRSYADALLLKLDRLRDDQIVRPVGAAEAPPMPPLPPLPPLDDLLPLSPSDYEVRFYDREYGDLDDVAVVESFPLAVQLAVDRHKADPNDLTEAGWTEGRGTLTVRSRHGTVLVRIEAIETPMPTVQLHVARACMALENGDRGPAQQLFTALRQAA